LITRSPERRRKKAARLGKLHLKSAFTLRSDPAALHRLTKFQKIHEGKAKDLMQSRDRRRD
jgi:hypothetical protein